MDEADKNDVMECLETIRNKARNMDNSGDAGLVNDYYHEILSACDTIEEIVSDRRYGVTESPDGNKTFHGVDRADGFYKQIGPDNGV